MQSRHTVQSAERLLTDAINSCPPAAPLYQSLQALRAPLSHLNHLTNLDIDAWQSTLNELVNFADDVAALLSRYRPDDPESAQRLKELHASAVKHEIDLDARGFLTAFHPSHAHAVQIRNISTHVSAPPDCIERIFHSLPALLTCVETLIAVRPSPSSINNALATALKSTSFDVGFPAPNDRIPSPSFSRYSAIRASVCEHVEGLRHVDNLDSHARSVLSFVETLMEPGILQNKRIRLYLPSKPFHLPFEVGRSKSATVYKAITSVCDGDNQLWITNVALKAYCVEPGCQVSCDSFHQEALRLRTLSHPCLPAFYGYHWPSTEATSAMQNTDFGNRPGLKVLIATELMTKDLSQARHLPALRPFKVRLRVLRDVADAIVYLHRQKLLHGRLNPHNVLLRMSREEVYGRIKVDVTCFVSRVLMKDSPYESSFASVLYRAPETRSKEMPFFTSDVWSMGILACFLFSKHKMFVDMTYEDILETLDVSSGVAEKVSEWIQSVADARLKHLIQNSLQDDPTKRIDSLSYLKTINEVMKDSQPMSRPYEEEYTETAADGNVVDEVIDSSTSHLMPKQSPDGKRRERHMKEDADLAIHVEGPQGVSSENESILSRSDTPLTPQSDERVAPKSVPFPTACSAESRQDCENVRAISEQRNQLNQHDKESDPSHDFALGTSLEKGNGVDQNIPRAILLYRSAHEKGYAKATFRLGQCYQTGIGVSKSPKTAFYLFEMAALSRHYGAMVEVGCSYETGSGVEENANSAASWFRQAADGGFAEGMRCFALCLQEGFGVRKDEKAALDLFKKASQAGNTKAGVELGRCYKEGIGTSVDLTLACQAFRWGAERNNARAQLEYANCLYEGGGVERDFRHAFRMYKRASEQGHMEACRNLGECYELGHGVEKDMQRAVGCFERASNSGNACAASSLAGCYERGEGVQQDMKKAVALYKKAERKQDYLALNNLGVLFERGVYFKQDYGKAVSYYRKALAQGFSEASCNLADCYRAGHGVAKDLQKAIELYGDAAADGHAGAKCELGNFFYRGIGVPRDCEKAVRLFREVSKAEPEALRLLGMAYFAGKGVDQDMDEAVRLFTKAEEAGNSEANLNLGLCYSDGHGVTKSAAEAVSCFEKAAAGGSQEAKLILGNMYYEGRGVRKNMRRAMELFMEGKDVDLEMEQKH